MFKYEFNMSVKKCFWGIAALFFCSVFSENLFGQTAGSTVQNNVNNVVGQVNPIETAVPFLRIDPDARSGAMGDAGIALSPDANSGYFDNASIPYSTDNLGLAASYTPWLRELVNDIYLAYLSGYYKIDNIQSINASLRYFSLGSINYTDINGASLGTGTPHEYSLDAGYSRKLADNFSMGVTLRYIESNLASGQEVSGVVVSTAHAIAGDLDFYYQKQDVRISTVPVDYAFGLTFTNIGSKVTYTDNALDEDYLPMNAGLGGAITFKFDKYNELTLTTDVDKLLVPTPDTTGSAANNGVPTYKTYSIPQAIISSLYQAPGGLIEKLEEITYSFGAEYWYNHQFAIRGGFFDENQYKGDLKYITAGVGVKYNVFGLDFAYLVPVNAQKNPLDNTLRFTLLFNFDALKKTQKKPENTQTPAN
jgi:hypothetical protein